MPSWPPDEADTLREARPIAGCGLRDYGRESIMTEKITMDKEALKKLRQVRKPMVAKAKEAIRTQNHIIGQIKAQIAEEARTIPAIARKTSLPTSQVLLFITGLKHYGLVAEVEKDGDYFKYRLIEMTDE